MFISKTEISKCVNASTDFPLNKETIVVEGGYELLLLSYLGNFSKCAKVQLLEAYIV
jgi:hypothetical protein